MTTYLIRYRDLEDAARSQSGFGYTVEGQEQFLAQDGVTIETVVKAYESARPHRTVIALRKQFGNVPPILGGDWVLVVRVLSRLESEADVLVRRVSETRRRMQEAKERSLKAQAERVELDLRYQKATAAYDDARAALLSLSE